MFQNQLIMYNSFIKNVFYFPSICWEIFYNKLNFIALLMNYSVFNFRFDHHQSLNISLRFKNPNVVESCTKKVNYFFRLRSNKGENTISFNVKFK
jgi:hypothetical protein